MFNKKRMRVKNVRLIREGVETVNTYKQKTKRSQADWKYNLMAQRKYGNLLIKKNMVEIIVSNL